MWELRSIINELSKQLIDSMSNESDVTGIRERLREAESRDPYLFYELKIDAMEKALEDGCVKEASKLR